MVTHMVNRAIPLVPASVLVLLVSGVALALTPDERHPEYGSAAIDPKGEVVVRSMGTWTITYRVGEKGFGPGDALRIGYSHLISDWGTPQIDSPKEPNYLRIYSSRPIRRTGAESRVRIMWGQPGYKTFVTWDGSVRLDGGQIRKASPVGFYAKQRDKIVSKTGTQVEWLSETGGGQDGILLEVDAPQTAVVAVKTKEGDFSFSRGNGPARLGSAATTTRSTSRTISPSSPLGPSRRCGRAWRSSNAWTP